MSEIIDYLKKVDEVIRSIKGIPYKFRENIEEWISERNRWIMYAAPSLISKSQAISAPLPNVWVGDPSENGDSVGMGLSYQTKPLVETFMQLDQIPNRETRDKILTILSNASEQWVFIVYQKTRWDTFATSPEYEEKRRIRCCDIDGQKLAEILRDLRQIQRESHARDERVNDRRIDYQGPSFDLMYTATSFPSADFIACIQEIFGIFEQCLLLKNKDTIDRELKEMRDEIRLLKVKIQEAEKMLRRSSLSTKSKKRVMELADSYRDELASYPQELRDGA